MSTLPSAVLFDWDNTLVDTLPLIRDANNDIRSKFGLPLWSLEEAHASTQHVGREGLRRSYGERWEEAERLFYEYVQAHHLDCLVAMDSAATLVEVLYRAGVPLGIVSNKRGPFLRAEVAHLGWADYFGVMLGPDDVGYSGKPKPDGIHAALKVLSIDVPGAVWYAGDTPIDMETARAAGVLPVYIENNTMSHSGKIAAVPPVFRFTGCKECLDYIRGLVDIA